MHILPITAKPVEPTGTFNGLLSSVLLGVHRGDFAGALSFKEAAAFANPDASLRGALNPAYNEVPRLVELDPTSPMALSIDIASRRNPKGGVGYTHEFRSLEYMSAISAQFASWYREYLTIYEMAKKAEAALSSGNYQLLDMELDIRYGEGHVAAYYAAVGDFSSSLIAYPISQPLSVEAVHRKVLTGLATFLDILDQVGYSEGESSAARVYGLGSLPQSGIQTAFLSSNTVDRLYRSPWARLLAVPRARDLMRRQFESRLDLLAATDTNVNGMVSITEGDDTFIFPNNSSWELLMMSIDQEGPLTNASYIDVDVDQRVNHWLGQMHTKGELTAQILEGNIDIAAGGGLSVCLGPLDDSPGFPVVENRTADTPYDTGALSSYNSINYGPDRFNWISGTEDISVLGSAAATECVLDGSSPSTLPNGLLYLGVCGEATALDWIRILRQLKLKYPLESKLLLERTGRSKKTLPIGVPTVASSDSLIAEMVSNGQRDGYLDFSMMAFNTSREARNEQEGPLFSASTNMWGVTEGGVSSYTLSGLNGWDRLDTSQGKFIIDPYGNQMDITAPIPSRFTGEWDAGRFSVWQPDMISESISTGSGSLVNQIAENLLAYPGVRSSAGVYQPRYIGDTAQATVDHLLVTADDSDDMIADPHWTSFGDTQFGTPGYEDELSLESLHPTRGFMRGLANYVSADPYRSVEMAPYLPRLVCDRTHLYDHTQTAVNGSTAVLNQHREMARLSLPSLLVEDAPNGASWHWDPTRAQIVGRAWHRWAGHMMMGALPHPYVAQPIAAFPASAELADLAALGTMASRPCGYFQVVDRAGNLPTLNAPESTQSVVVETSSNWYSKLDPRILNVHSNDMDAYLNTLLVPVNGSSAYDAVIGDAIADKTLKAVLNAGAGAVTLDNDPADPLFDTASNMDRMPLYDMYHPIVNGCQRKKVGVSTGATLESGWFVALPLPNTTRVVAEGTILPLSMQMGTANPGPNAGDIDVLTSTDVPSHLVSRTEGEIIVPIHATGSSRPKTMGNLIITGKGFNFTEDLTSHQLMDGLGWLKAQYNADGSLIMNNYKNTWPVSGLANGSITEIELPALGHNFVPVAETDEWYNSIGVGRNYELRGSHDDWFRKGAVLTGRHARLRQKTLVNPWVRGAGAAGIFNLQYDSSAVLPEYLIYNAMLRKDGEQYQKGLENSLFLEVHQAN